MVVTMKRILIFCIKFYRRQISPLKGVGCSEYALEAVEKYGAIKGGYLAIKRILRCRPLGGYGYDPVP